MVLHSNRLNWQRHVCLQTKVEEEHLKELKKEKEEREARLIIEKLREDCATKIQSWWRGTMVRWEFGKYCEIMKKKFKKQKKPKK